MPNAFAQDHAQYPLARITTLGEFALERLVRAPSRNGDEPARYERVGRSEWSNRGPAMALLKVLLCRANRRACREELIEAIWPDHEAINAAHALDSAASVLRRHVLRAGEAVSLLLTLRSGGETIFKLAGQQRLWVDADALLSLASRALRAECQGRNPLPLLEEAHALARGEFLEDALCRLMVLLVEQERRQEALQLYQYAEDVLHEERAEPAVYTRELARRIRQGLVLRERREGYTVARIQTLPLVEPHARSKRRRDGFGATCIRLTSHADAGEGQTLTPYRYPPLRRRARRQGALPIG